MVCAVIKKKEMVCALLPLRALVEAENEGSFYKVTGVLPLGCLARDRRSIKPELGNSGGLPRGSDL